MKAEKCCETGTEREEGVGGGCGKDTGGKRGCKLKGKLQFRLCDLNSGSHSKSLCHLGQVE